MAQLDRRRRFARHVLHAPVEFDSGRGITRNISVGGVYFDTPARIDSGMPMTFRIVLRQHGDDALTLLCVGTVVRVDRVSDRYGVAATIDHFASIEGAGFPA